MEYLIQFVTDFGYWAIFLLVFLQEIGIPNPVPNELVLIFAGAFTTIGGLSFWLTFLIAVTADVIGTTVLYSVFYFFEHFIMERVRRWNSINVRLDRIKEKILKHGRWGIFVGRLLPYLRGYVSAAAGLLNIPYRVFLPMIIIPAILWTGGYIILGHFLGKEWRRVADFINQYQWIVVLTVILTIGVWLYFKTKKDSKTVV